MGKIRFTKKLGTSNYGLVEIGDVVDVSDIDARRYIGNGFAEAMATPKKAPVRRGKAGTG